MKDIASLRELLLIEFKNCLPQRIVTFFNEQKVPTFKQAAILAEEFTLTHKSNFAQHALASTRSAPQTANCPSVSIPSVTP